MEDLQGAKASCRELENKNVIFVVTVKFEEQNVTLSFFSNT